MFTKEENERYSRHIRLRDFGIDAQEKLRNASVLVIGAGGLGCPVLLYLAAAGVGKIGIADSDTITLSNLQRQVLYQTDELGQLKVTAAVRRLQQLNPHTRFIEHAERVGFSNADSLISEYEIIIDTTDNIPARYIINDACVRLGKPLIYGAIFRWEGQVSVFNHQGGPTYRCLFPDPPGDIVLSCDEEGVVGVVPGLIGTWQALEAIKIITGTGEVLSGKLLTVDLQSNLTRIIKFSRNQDSVRKAFEAPDVNEVPTDNLDSYLDRPELTILDVRTEAEFSTGNVGGLNIPLDRLPDHLRELGTHPQLLVLCQTGRRSVEAIRQLRESGYKGTCYNLTEGLKPYLSSAKST